MGGHLREREIFVFFGEQWVDFLPRSLGGGASFLLTKKWWCIRGKGKFVSFWGSNGSIFCPVPWQCDLVYQFFQPYMEEVLCGRLILIRTNVPVMQSA